MAVGFVPAGYFFGSRAPRLEAYEEPEINSSQTQRARSLVSHCRTRGHSDRLRRRRRWRDDRIDVDLDYGDHLHVNNVDGHDIYGHDLHGDDVDRHHIHGYNLDRHHFDGNDIGRMADE